MGHGDLLLFRNRPEAATLSGMRRAFRRRPTFSPHKNAHLMKNTAITPAKEPILDYITPAHFLCNLPVDNPLYPTPSVGYIANASCIPSRLVIPYLSNGVI